MGTHQRYQPRLRRWGIYSLGICFHGEISHEDDVPTWGGLRRHYLHPENRQNRHGDLLRVSLEIFIQPFLHHGQLKIQVPESIPRIKYRLWSVSYRRLLLRQPELNYVGRISISMHGRLRRRGIAGFNQQAPYHGFTRNQNGCSRSMTVYCGPPIGG